MLSKNDWKVVDAEADQYRARLAEVEAKLREVEKERDAARKIADHDKALWIEAVARAERAEAALATARLDALEEAATLTVAIEGIGHCQMPVRWRDAIRALIAQEQEPTTN